MRLIDRDVMCLLYMACMLYDTHIFYGLCHCLYTIDSEKALDLFDKHGFPGPDISHKFVFRDKYLKHDSYAQSSSPPPPTWNPFSF
jgi:hypothetical protein